MKKKVLWILNFGLILIALFLALHFFEIELPVVGKAQETGRGGGVCVAVFEGERSLLREEERCCLELQRQWRCEDWQSKLILEGEEWRIDKRCYTGEKAAAYFVDNNIYNYCEREGYLGYKRF